MKNLIKLLILCLIPITALADSPLCIRNDAASTTLTGTNLDTGALAVDSKGRLYTSLAGVQVGGSTVSAYQAEDAAHVSGDAGVFSLAVRNSANVTFCGDGDYSPISVGTNGQVFVDLNKAQVDDAGSVVKGEDAASADGDGVVVIAGVREDALTSTSTTGDYSTFKMDGAGRLITGGAPQGSMVTGCNTAITTATTGSMIAALASNFTFITSWNCTNTGGAASRVILEDGDGTDLANVMLAATTGFAAVIFPTPVRTNVVNKAIQINVITTGTSTICCASGFTGIA